MDLIYVGNFRPQLGGAAISCAELMAAFARRGCRVRVLASATREAEAETLAYDRAQNGVEIRRFPVPFYFNRPHEPAPADWEQATRQGVASGLQRMIAEAAPDVLVVREGWVPFVTEMAGRHSIPQVALVRGNPTGAVVRKEFPAEAAEAYLAELRKVHRIVTVADHYLPPLRALGFENVTSIGNAIDIQTFAPRGRPAELAGRLRIGEKDVVVMHGGMPRPIKRSVDIVRAAPAVLERNPNVLFLIVGDGPSRPEMEELSRKLGVSGRFRFEPYQPYERMPEYVNLSDIVVMPSESEGLSRMYVEAQACAKTLIASNIAPAREVVTDCETGLLFRKGDIGHLAETTLLAAGDAPLRTRIGARARGEAKKRSIEAATGQYLALLEELWRPIA